MLPIPNESRRLTQANRFPRCMPDAMRARSLLPDQLQLWLNERPCFVAHQLATQTGALLILVGSVRAALLKS